MSDKAKVVPEEEKKEKKDEKKDENKDDKKEEVDDGKIENGPVEQRSCTDIICFLLFIAQQIAMVVLFSRAVSEGTPEKLIAVYDASNKSCGIDIQGKPYLYFTIPHPDFLNETTCVAQCPNYYSEEDKPQSLDCNINNATQSCDEFCSPLDLVNSGGWGALSGGVPFWDLFCIYNTTPVLQRICFPGEDVTKILKDLSKGMADNINLDTITKWFDDVENSWPVILGSFFITFLLGIIYMIFVRIFSGLIVWVCILGYFLSVFMLGYFLYNKAQAIRIWIDENEIEQDPNTENNYQTYLYCSYAVFGIVAISFIGLICMLRNIKLAIAVIKTATVYVIETPSVMFVPPILAVAVAIWWSFWIVGFVFLYSIGNFFKSNYSVFGQVEHDEETFYQLWYFVFGGLWNNAFLQALSQFVLASTACIWYYAQGPQGNSHMPVTKSFYRVFRFHLGSLAFGSLILAIVQLIRLILEYVRQQMKTMGGDNKVMKWIMACLQCYMACFQRFIEFLTRNAYIQIALTGKNFCSAAKEAMRMIWANPTRLALVNGLGAAFVFIGKLFMIIATILICYRILTEVEPYTKTVSSAFLPCLIIFFISYAVSTVFMMVYAMGIDAILMCFLHDEESCKGGEPKFCPSTLRDFFEAKSQKKAQKKENKINKQKQDAEDDDD